MKKLLSIFLALAMLISLIPTVFAADAETEKGIKVVYDFKSDKFTELEALGKDNNDNLDLTTLTYAESKGFWQYADSSLPDDTLTNSSSGLRADSSGNVKVVANQSKPKYWIAVKINVPKQAKYNLNLGVYNSASSNALGKAININAFIFKADAAVNIEDSLVIDNDYNFNATCTARQKEDTLDIGTEPLDAGEYYFVLNPYHTYTSGGPYVFLRSLTLTEGDGTQSVPMISSLTSTTENDVTTVTATAAKMSNGDDATDIIYSYAVADDDAALASVNESTGVVTGLADGTATIIATATKDGLSSSKSIEVAVTAPAAEPEQDEALSDAFEVTEKTEENYSEPNVITVSVNNADVNSVKNSNGTHTITAPETNGEGKSFLYWAKGLTAQKKIISFSNVLSDYVPDAKYANYLIAVYEGEEAQSAEYYNANGQLVGTKNEPSLPSMAGYGKAKEWKQFGETNIHVAQYELEAPSKNIAITVNNGTGTGTYAYGDTVTCMANGSGTFKCWTKSGINGETEIVSCDETYIFKAWEECTVEAVYEDYTYKGNKAKIIIDSFVAGSETGVMAEFVGFDNAVEKGIMFTDSNKNTMRIAMTTKDNQFTVIADKNGIYNGYAIVKGDDESYALVTDGSYEHTK